MGKRYNGEIIELHKNYGMIKTTINNKNVLIYFNALPSMICANGKANIHRNVSFETRKMIWMGVNIICAYNINDEGGPLVLFNELRIKDNNFSRFLFASLRPNSIPGKNTLDKLIDAESKVCLFYLKWILFIEKTSKLVLAKAIELEKKSTKWLISKLEENCSTKKIIKCALDGIKDKTWLHPASDFVVFSKKENDPNDIVVTDAPVELLLSTVTISELAEIIKTIFPEITHLKEKNSDLYIFLWYLEGMLLDLSVVRNAAAHGNAISPIIIDNTFSPAYFYEMADVFPQWNSNDALNNAESYKAFTFIRFLTKGEAKGGVHLTDIPFGSPQHEALFFTKSLYLNPARKSFFSMFFLIHAIFSFVDDGQRDNFYKDLHESGLSFFSGDDETPFTGFPSKENSISKRLLSVVWLVLKFAEKDIFKCYATICMK